MVLLFLILLIGAAFAEIHKKENTVKFFYALLGILVLIEGTRWYSGTDFAMYFNSYQQVLNLIPEYHNLRYDRLYLWLTILFKSLQLDYTWLLLFLSTLTTFLYGWALKKYTDFPIIALLVLFVSLIGFLGSNRQLIALSLVFFGVYFILAKRYFLYVMTVFLAMGFHFTAIIMLPLVFLNREICLKKWFVFFLLLLALLLMPFKVFLLYFLESNQNSFSFLLERFNSYLAQNLNTVSLSQIALGTLRKLIPVLIAMIYKNQLKDKTGYYFFLNTSILSIALYLFLGFTFSFLLGRLTIYYSVFECVVYSWIGYLYLKRKQDTLALLLFFAFCVFLFFKGISLYPELFIPYRTRFFTL